MAKMGFEKRLEKLEQLANVRKADRPQVYFCDGSIEEMDVLSLLYRVIVDPQRSVIRYDVQGNADNRKLLQIVDQFLH